MSMPSWIQIGVTLLIIFLLSISTGPYLYDWQAYSGETTLSNFSQMAAITWRKRHRDSFLDLTARPENDEFHTAAL